MRKRAWCLVLAAVLAACVSPPYSLGRIYSAERLVWDPDLVGEWRNPDGGFGVRFDRDGFYRSQVTITGDEGTLQFTGYGTSIAGERWIDLAPLNPAPDNEALLTLHLFVPYAVRADTLWYRYCGGADWVRLLGPGHWVDNPGGPGFLVASPETLRIAAAALMTDTTVTWESGYFVRALAGGSLARAR